MEFIDLIMATGCIYVVVNIRIFNNILGYIFDICFC